MNWQKHNGFDPHNPHNKKWDDLDFLLGDDDAVNNNDIIIDNGTDNIIIIDEGTTQIIIIDNGLQN